MKYLDGPLHVIVGRGAGLLIILSAFLFSYCVRFPYLNRPLGGQHEWITAHALIAIENLSYYPVSTHLFRLISTYPTSTNYHVTDWVIVRLMSPEGIGFYTTYPPFAAILPHIVFSVFRIDVNIYSIQVFNIIVHFFATVFLFLTIYQVAPARKFFSSLMGSLIYAFSSSTLWFFSSTYSWDTLWYQLLVIDLFFIIQAVNKPKNRAYPLAAGAVTALLVYTELQGLLFVSITVALLVLLNHNRGKMLSLLLLVSSSISLFFYILQNSLITGFSTYAQMMYYKIFVQYSTMNSETASVIDQALAIENYSLLLFPSLLLLLVLLIIAFISRRSLRIFNRQQTMLLLIPILIFAFHALILFPDIIIHEFASLVLINGIAYAAGFGVSSISLQNNHMKIAFYLLSIISMIIFISKSLHDYKIYAGPDPYTYYQDFSNEINLHLNPDQVLFFITDNLIHPQVTYFTKRNFAVVNSAEEAIDILYKIGMSRGKVFWLDKGGQITKTQDISIVLELNQ
jgi:hypothetical protein